MRARSILLTTVDLANGTMLYSQIHSAPRPRLWHNPMVWTTLATALVLVVLLMFAARRISRPLKELAKAADRLGTQTRGITLEENGPDDVRAAIRAFNRMDRRLNRMLEHQRRMIAAVGHDLRTPLTALRVRAEFVTDEENRERMIRIINEMDVMTEGILSLVREESREEPYSMTDLSALVQSLCDDFTDLGATMSVDAEPRVVLPIRGGAITRVLRNLIENAIRYGGNADVTVKAESIGGAVITIEDNGPGIDDASLSQVFEPFVRLEASRNSETGGLGLGLTIARSLVDAEGGTLTLENRPEGGLKATVKLPHLPHEAQNSPTPA